MTDEVQSREPGEFYLIWTKGGRNPQVSHQTFEGAQTEARRLAARYPHRRWFILRAVERLWVREAEDQVR